MWYEINDGRLQMWKKEDNAVVEINPVPPPYFFIEKEKDPVMRYMASKRKISYTNIKTDLVTMEKKPVNRIEMFYPPQVSYMRQSLPIETYESDVPFERRVRIDKKWQTSDNYRTAFFDIETMTKDIDGYKNGQLLCISLVTDKKEIIISDKDEYTVCLEFLDKIRDIDLLVGYASDMFDVPQLKEKLKQYDLSFPRSIRTSDMYWMLKTSRQRMLPSWKLGDVSKTLIEEERIYHDQMIHDLSMEHIEARCMQDSILLQHLEDKFGLVSTSVAKAHISCLFPDQVDAVGRCIDTLMLQKAREDGYVLPNKSYKKGEKHSGAFVLQPPKPLFIYNNILILDVASLYPNIIIQYKISPDAEKNFYPSILTSLLEERLRWKREWQETKDDKAKVRQEALKVLLCAFYGVLNASGFRLLDSNLGDEVASRGRTIIQSLIDEVRRMGFEVVGGDTDSMFVKIEDMSVDSFPDLEEKLNRFVKKTHNVDLEVEASKLFESLYFPRKSMDTVASKKKYSGMVIWEKKRGVVDRNLEVVGLEYVRSDFPAFIRELQFRLIDMFLEKTDEDTITDFLYDYKKMLYGNVLSPEELALSKTITKLNYKVVPQHMKAAIKAAERGVPYRAGDKIQFVHTRGGVEPLPLLKNARIDYDYYWDSIVSVVDRTLGIDLSGNASLDSWTNGS